MVFRILFTSSFITTLFAEATQRGCSLQRHSADRSLVRCNTSQLRNSRIENSKQFLPSFYHTLQDLYLHSSLYQGPFRNYRICKLYLLTLNLSLYCHNKNRSSTTDTICQPQCTLYHISYIYISFVLQIQINIVAV